MGYGNQTKESNLTKVTTLSSSDLVRVVVGGLSRNITFDNFLNSSNGNLSLISVSSAYTAAVGVKVVLCDVSGGAFTVTLPDATTSGVGSTIYVKKIDGSTNNVTVAAGAGDTIDGSSTAILSGSGGAKPWVRLVSDASNWYIISG